MKWRRPNLALPLFSKELGEMAQRRQTYIARLAFAIFVFLMSLLIFLPTFRAARLSPFAVLGQGGRLLDVIYEIEWWGLCLFVPALVSPTLAAEKERQTLQLLFLTRLGPWTIVLEKLLSRFVPVGTFLLVSLPLLLIAYLLGGVTQHDVGFAALGLVASAFQIGCIAIFCSAFFGTTAMALVTSYVITAFVSLLPYLVLLLLVLYQSLYRGMVGHYPEFLKWIDEPQMQVVLARGLGTTSGIDLVWFFGRGLAPGSVRPFHRNFHALMLITGIGAAFLVAARLAIVRRAELRPAHRFRRFLQFLDRRYNYVNDRLAFGIVLGGRSHALPGDRPVAWRENRRGNLGRFHYLVRIVLLLELPILVPTVTYVLTTRDLRFSALDSSGFFLWPIAILIVTVRSAGLIAAEKARQTLDVLLTTPLPLSAVAGQKLRGLWRVMAIVSVPILIQAAFIGYFHISASGPHSSYYSSQGFNPSQSAQLHFLMVALNLIVMLSLAAQLAFLFGLKAKTQGHAVTAALGVFAAWSLIPFFIRLYANNEAWIMYLSPISGIVLNELPQLARSSGLSDLAETGRFGFYALIHLGIYAAVAAFLAWFNHGLSGRILCRPVKSTTSRLFSRVAAPSSNPSAT
jgi:ABC-type transport system involved in multi-copper enzyme maturation permease subunit